MERYLTETENESRTTGTEQLAYRKLSPSAPVEGSLGMSVAACEPEIIWSCIRKKSIRWAAKALPHETAHPVHHARRSEGVI